jgi:hypothetical protein
VSDVPDYLSSSLSSSSYGVFIVFSVVVIWFVSYSFISVRSLVVSSMFLFKFCLTSNSSISFICFS